jgi:repressor LexA
MTEKSTSLGKRIKEVREILGLSRTEFAEKTGVSYDSQESYENDRSKPTTDYWRTFEGLTSPEDLIYAISGDRPMSFEKGDLVKIPILGTINASSLTQGFSDNDVVDWIWTKRSKDKEVFGLKVQGNSMFPQIHSGDYAMLAPNRQFVNGKVYAVVARDSQHTIKTVFKERGGYRLVPANPDYQSDFVTDEDIIRLVRVVQVISAYEEL